MSRLVINDRRCGVRRLNAGDDAYTAVIHECMLVRRQDNPDGGRKSAVDACYLASRGSDARGDARLM
ncbi:MAG: hypothetical protein ABI411_03925 [Tahibacter sp.]